MPATRPTTQARAIAAAKALDPSRFDEAALKSARGRRGGVRWSRPSRRCAPRLFDFQREFRRGAARRGARRPRHRHGDLPRRRREDFRHRHARGARPPPRRWSFGAAASRPTRPRCWPTSCTRDERDTNRAVAPLQAGRGCALARYHAFGYRRRIPGRHRHRRGRPSGPRARLTAPRGWRTKPRFAPPPRRPDLNHRSDRSVDRAGLPVFRQSPKVLRDLRPARSERPSTQPAGAPLQETTWPLPLLPRRRAKISPRCSTSPSAAGNLQEGSVVKGTVVGIEKDMAVIDVGAEDRRPRRGRANSPGPGRRQRDQDRRRGRGLSGARRERARRGGAVARQGAPRGKLGQAREGVQEQREGHRRHLQPGQGRLHRRSRRRRGVPAALAGRHPSDPRRHAR